MRKLTTRPAWFLFWTVWCTFWALVAGRLALDELALVMDGPAHAVLAIIMLTATACLAIGIIVNVRGYLISRLHLGIRR